MNHPEIEPDAEGNLRLNFGDYGDEVEIAAISGNGRRVLTVREVDRARVWELETGECVAELVPDSPLRDRIGEGPSTEPFQVFIESAALDHDGNFALLGLNDGTAVVYHIGGARRLSTLFPPDEQPANRWSVIRSVRYSADGELALVGFSGRRLGVWSGDGSRLLAFLQAKSGDRLFGRPFVRDTLVSSMAASGDGRSVFMGAVDGTAAVFDLASGTILFEATEHTENILAIFDGSAGIGWATTGGNVWVSRAGKPAAKVVEAGEAWTEVVFDGERVLARGRDGKVACWTFEGERNLLFEPFEPSKPKPELWSHKAATLGIVGDRVHYPESSRRLALRDGERSIVILRDQSLARVALSPACDLVATNGWKDEVELWDATSGAFVRSLPCPGGSGCFAFASDGSLLATGEIGHGGGFYRRHIQVFDVKTGLLRWALGAHDWQVRQVAFSLDGRLLASLGDDLVVWKLDALARGDDVPMLRVPLDRTTGAFAFAGAHADIVALERGRVRVFADGELRRAFDAPIRYGASWVLSDDGRYLVIGLRQRAIRFDLETGELDRQIVADIPRPERLPSIALAQQHEIRGTANFWRSDFGVFLHQSDGPRGWIEPLELSAGGMVAVPCTAGAAVLRITSNDSALLGTVAFEGKLRASRVVGNAVLLVNHEGRLFRASLMTS